MEPGTGNQKDISVQAIKPLLGGFVSYVSVYLLNVVTHLFSVLAHLASGPSPDS